MADVMTPYTTGKPYWAGPIAQWMPEDDAQRVASYQLYEEMYWGQNDEGVEVEDGTPLAIPVGKALIEAIHRFLAVGWDFKITGTDTNDVCKTAFSNLFAREQVKSKVSTAKRYGLIRGDAMLHIVADPNKPQGSRLSIYELDPASYFPIYDLDEPDRILGAHIVEQIMDAEDKLIIRRQTYRKDYVEAPTGEKIFTGMITSELALFETEGWDDRFGRKPEDIKQITVLVPEYVLPAPITQIPIYHWKNTRNPADIFGSSVFRGVESILKSIDQTITDQDLALALASLGVYETDSGAPMNPDGTPAAGWIIGPGRVVEIARGTHFNRVQGITSVQPSIDHANYLESKARAGAGVPAVAIGEVDVPSAESGIALALKFMPLLAANAERELELISKLDQFLFDLQTMWFPAYEQMNFGDPTLLSVTSVVRDPMPVNRKTVIEETLTLVADGMITMKMAIQKLASLGWEYTEEDINALIAERDAKKAAENAPPDAFADRAADEVGAGDAQ